MYYYTTVQIFKSSWCVVEARENIYLKWRDLYWLREKSSHLALENLWCGKACLSATLQLNFQTTFSTISLHTFLTCSGTLLISVLTFWPHLCLHAFTVAQPPLCRLWWTPYCISLPRLQQLQGVFSTHAGMCVGATWQVQQQPPQSNWSDIQMY